MAAAGAIILAVAALRELVIPLVLAAFFAVVFASGVDWLEARDPERPFLLMCQHKAPHRTWAPAPSKHGLYQGLPGSKAAKRETSRAHYLTASNGVITRTGP